MYPQRLSDLQGEPNGDAQHTGPDLTREKFTQLQRQRNAMDRMEMQARWPTQRDPRLDKTWNEIPDEPQYVYTNLAYRTHRDENAFPPFLYKRTGSSKHHTQTTNHLDTLW